MRNFNEVEIKSICNVPEPTENLQENEVPVSSVSPNITVASPSRNQRKRFSVGRVDDASLDTPRKKRLKQKVHELLTVNQLKSQQVRRLQKMSWRQKKTISSLKSLTEELKKKNLLLLEHEQLVLDDFGPNKEIITRLFKISQKKAVSRKFEPSVRAFAVTLHFFSPRAYFYVRQNFFNCLPHPKTLCKWYSSINAGPGFTTEAFDFLRSKVRASDKQLVCSLVFDEVAIRQHAEYDGVNYHGYVNFGGEVHVGDGTQRAKEALVFMLVCINEAWKLPLGYFFIAGLNCEQKASLTKQCLTLLNEVGIVTITVTFDGCRTNFSMCNALGCNMDPMILKTHFIYNNVKYFVLPDPAHMIKCIRNCFADKKQLVDVNGNIIDYAYVVALNELQEQEGMHLGNRLRKQHIAFFKQKMKVKLATQLLSRSVAEALLYCEQKLKLTKFANCGPTAHFILLMNHAFDILNSRKLSEANFKKAVCPQNIENIK